MKFFVLILLFYPVGSIGQHDRTQFQNQFSIQVRKNTAEKVRIDGKLDEPCWQTADVARDFWSKWPKADVPAQTPTTVQLTYDSTHLYVAATCFDTGGLIIQSLKRDAQYWDSDGIAILLDPANKATNGYFFACNPLGVQTEGMLSASNNGDEFFTWDNRWYVETTIYPDRWVAEFAIPFQIIRFDENNREWGVNFIRNDASEGFWYTWTRIPLQFEGTDLGYTGKLIFETPPRCHQRNYNLAPYFSGAVARNQETGEPQTLQPNFGLDAKIGIGSALNLDLTINPDFSQVEVDEQVINLTRFNIQLPEKRTFFLENADIFSNYGIPPIRPFFSRTIGLDDNAQPLPILFGARLTGNLDAKTRIGAMNIFTQAKQQLPGQNFTALSVQRRLLGRSSVKAYFLNRQAYSKSAFSRHNYARNAGGDYLFSTIDGKWFTWGSYHHSFQPNVRRQSGWGDAGAGYSGERFTAIIDVLKMGVNYRAEMGFEARLNNYDVEKDSAFRWAYGFIYSEGEFRFPAKEENSKLNLFSLRYENFSVLQPDGSLNEQNNEISGYWRFRNTAEVDAGIRYTWANVPVHFEFGNYERDKCPALPPGIYQFVVATGSYQSDVRRRLGWFVETTVGQFYNGKQYAVSSAVNFRAQPWGNFQVQAEYNHLDFPSPVCDVSLINITPRIEIFFHRNLNWTTFLQFNNQANNFNINCRIQWRFRPMSDVFLVFTENYFADTRQVRNRSMVLKINYWI